MMKSENVTNLLKALIQAKSKIQPPKKTKKSYTNTYAPLEEVLSKVDKPLHDHGLVLSHDRNLETKLLVTYLFHESGEFISTCSPLDFKSDGKVNAMQSMGAASTYAMRYNICALLSLCGEEDTDAVELIDAKHIEELESNWPKELLDRALKSYNITSWEKFPVSLYEGLINRLNKSVKNAN